MNDKQNQDAGVVFNNTTQNLPQDNDTVVIDQPMPQSAIPPAESVQKESPQPQNAPANENLTPEVIPDDIAAPPSNPPPESYPTETGDEPPPIYEENKSKFIFMGVAALVFVIIFVILIKLLIGGKSKTPQKVTLTYWGLWEDKGVIAPIIQDYQSKNPQITINYVKMDPQDYRAKILARSKEGKGPDIFRYHNTWLPTITDVVAPLPRSIISDTEFKKTFYPVQQTDLNIKGYYYGIPLEIDGLVLVYNDDLLKRAGIASPPKTWEEVMDDIAKLTVKDQDGAIITSGLAIGSATNVDHFSDIFGWMLLQNGGDLKNLKKDEGKGTMELFRRFAEAPNNVWDENMPNSINAFIQGKVAMIIVPSWEIGVMKQLNPDLNLKVAVLPILPGGNLLSLANYWVEGVSRYSKNQVESWKFLQFLVQKDNLTKMYTEASKTRPFGEPYSRTDLASTLQSDPFVGPVIQQAPFMKSLPLVSRTQDDGLNDEIVKYLEDAINSVTKGVSYEDALNTAQKGVDQVFTKYKIE